MTSLSRTKLLVCKVKGCPAPESEAWHIAWCRDIPGHECFGGASHQHWPKRSQGGKDIVACLCVGAHDRIDNGDWGNAVLETPGISWAAATRVYRAWDRHNNTLIWRVISPPWWEDNDDTTLPRGGRTQDDQRAEGQDGAVFLRGLRPDDSGGEDTDPQGSLREPRGPIQELDFGPDYLTLPQEYRLEDAVQWAGFIGKYEHGRQWYAGDLVNDLEARFGHERVWGHSVMEDGRTIIDLLGMKSESVRNCQRVCAVFPRYRGRLTFGHYSVVYRCQDAAEWLDKAETGAWTVAELRRQVGGHERPETCTCPSCGNVHKRRVP